MATTHVSRTEGGSTAAVASIAATAQSHTAGNVLIAVISRQNGGVAVTLSDTAGNTWHQAGTDYVGAGNTNYMSIWYAYNIIGNASNVVTCTSSSGTGSFFMIVVHEFAGMGTSDPYSASRVNNEGNSTAPSTASVTITGPDGVVIAFVEADLQTITGGSGYTMTSPIATIGYFGDEYKIVTASEAPTAACGNNPWRMVAAGFNSATVVTSHNYSFIVNKHRPGMFKPGRAR